MNFAHNYRKTHKIVIKPVRFGYIQILSVFLATHVFCATPQVPEEDAASQHNCAGIDTHGPLCGRFTPPDNPLCRNHDDAPLPKKRIRSQLSATLYVLDNLSQKPQTHTLPQGLSIFLKRPAKTFDIDAGPHALIAMLHKTTQQERWLLVGTDISTGAIGDSASLITVTAFSTDSFALTDKHNFAQKLILKQRYRKDYNKIVIQNKEQDKGAYIKYPLPYDKDCPAYFKLSTPLDNPLRLSVRGIPLLGSETQASYVDIFSDYIPNKRKAKAIVPPLTITNPEVFKGYHATWHLLYNMEQQPQAHTSGLHVFCNPTTQIDTNTDLFAILHKGDTNAEPCAIERSATCVPALHNSNPLHDRGTSLPKPTHQHSHPFQDLFKPQGSQPMYLQSLELKIDESAPFTEIARFELCAKDKSVTPKDKSVTPQESTFLTISCLAHQRAHIALYKGRRKLNEATLLITKSASPLESHRLTPHPNLRVYQDRHASWCTLPEDCAALHAPFHTLSQTMMNLADKHHLTGTVIAYAPRHSARFWHAGLQCTIACVTHISPQGRSMSLLQIMSEHTQPHQPNSLQTKILLYTEGDEPHTLLDTRVPDAADKNCPYGFKLRLRKNLNETCIICQLPASEGFNLLTITNSPLQTTLPDNTISLLGRLDGRWKQLCIFNKHQTIHR